MSSYSITIWNWKGYSEKALEEMRKEQVRSKDLTLDNRRG
jgi:hypothetical protein